MDRDKNKKKLLVKIFWLNSIIETSTDDVISKSALYFQTLYPNGLPTLKVHTYKNRQSGNIIVSKIEKNQYKEKNVFV